MSLAISGTGITTATAAGATVQPFKAASVQDSLQNATTLGVQNLFITVSDSNGGGPTDADGTFAPSLPLFRQVAPGTYILTRGPNYDPAATAPNDLQALNFTVGQTPSTAVITLVAADDHGQSAMNNATEVVAAVSPAKLAVIDTTSQKAYAVAGTPYSGPVAGVSTQFVVQTDSPALSADNLNVAATAPGVFIHTGSGADAIDVSGVGGSNVLDGGTGSNFLTGGLAGKGADTFFVDARNAASDIWDTVSNFHAGDAVTLFGITPTSKAIAWVDNQGAGAATGLTLHATQAGTPEASFTLAGYTTADLSNGRLAVTYGTEADGTPYLNVVGLR